MPSTPINLQLITSAICRHWRDALTEPVATAFPGAPLNTDALAEWYELSLDQWASVLRRDGDPEQTRLVLHLRAFVRLDTATGRVLDLADEARAAFSRVDVEIVDDDLSDGAVVGVIRFDDGQLRDFSRADRDRQRAPLRHIEWTWNASVRA